MSIQTVINLTKNMVTTVLCFHYRKKIYFSKHSFFIIIFTMCKVFTFNIFHSVKHQKCNECT